MDGFVAQFAVNEGRWPEDPWKLSILLDVDNAARTTGGYTVKKSLFDDSFCC